MKDEGSLKMTKTVSVLMPVFNRESYVEYAIRSIISQTNRNYKFMIYDDGSTDKTPEVLCRYAAIDKRIKVFRDDKNKGVAYARNFLLRNCDTKYACWQDSDDISHPTRIDRQIAWIDEKSLVFAGWHWFLDEGGKRKLIKRHLVVDRATPTLMFPVDKSIKFDDEMRFGGEDWDWIKRMKEKYDNVVDVTELLYYLRYHSDRIGNIKRLMKDGDEKLSYEQVAKLRKKEHGIF
jgi:glycosyltransferase involved in cell wall biosynthesis